MSYPWNAYAWGGAVILTIMVLLWLRQLKTGNGTTVDLAWTAGLGIMAATAAYLGTGLEERRWLIGVLGVIWSGRLLLHLWKRVIGSEEDGRYASFREGLGENARAKFFFVYVIQGLLDVVLGIPFVLAASRMEQLGVFDYAALALIAVAAVGVAIADKQLRDFKADPSTRGRTCRRGLWRYSRHPNYFFEWLVWCGWAVLALPAAWGWVGLSGPAIMLFLFLKVTGIPPTEEQALKSRGDDYRRYQRETNAFFPGPVKEQA